jgi:hypothetical protein
LTRFWTQTWEKHGERKGDVIQMGGGQGEGTTERGEAETEECRDGRTKDWKR